MKKLSVVGIDIAKQVFHLVGMDKQGTILVRKRLYRAQVMAFLAQLPPTLIGMEACGGAHYWARRLREYGHEVKLMAPQFVKPYVKANKNDMRDAEAIAEAVTRPTMRFVPTKDVGQQDLQALHRVRERLPGERTALVNEVHGLLHEYGIVIPKGVAKFRQAVVEKLESEQDKLTPLSQEMFWKLVEEFVALEKQLAYLPGEARSPGHDASRVSASDDNPGDWALKCDGLSGRRQRCQRVQERSPVCCVAGARATPTFHWREGALVGHQQTWRQLCAQTAQPRGTGDAALGWAQDRPTKPVDAATARASRQKPHGRGSSQQKCPDGLGVVDEPPGLSAGAGLKTRPSVGTALSLCAPRGAALRRRWMASL
jgi:hypothetical protein